MLVNFLTKSYRKSMNDIREKMKSGTISEDDLKMSDEDTRERIEKISANTREASVTLHKTKGLYWMHIPYNDRDVIERKESLMTHLKAQCPRIPSGNMMNIDSSELFSGAIAFNDPNALVVDPNSADLIIHIGLPDALYEMLKTAPANAIKSMFLCTSYYDADGDMLEGMSQGYYPKVSVSDFKTCYFINWNNTFWNALSTTPDVVITTSRSAMTRSSSRIGYTTSDVNRPGDLFVKSEEYLKRIEYTSSGMPKYDHPEDAYKHSPLRNAVRKSYKSDDEKYIVSPELVNKLMKRKDDSLQGLVDDTPTGDETDSSLSGLVDETDDNGTNDTTDSIPVLALSVSSDTGSDDTTGDTTKTSEPDATKPDVVESIDVSSEATEHSAATGGTPKSVEPLALSVSSDTGVTNNNANNNRSNIKNNKKGKAK